MRTLMVWDEAAPSPADLLSPVGALAFVDKSVHTALCRRPSPPFEPRRAAFRSAVLVKVRAFSVNYRDRTRLQQVMKASAAPVAIGSEFAGDVVDVGPEVKHLYPGDRIMGDCSYPTTSSDRPKCPGIPTVQASEEYVVLDESQAHRVPRELPYEVVAAMGLNGQTAVAMLRRLAPRSGERLVVMSASSNTSLAVLEAARNHQIDVVAMTRSVQHIGRLQALGVGKVVLLGSQPRGWLEHAPPIGELRADCVADPFCSINFLPALQLLRTGGRYVTCGLVDAQMPWHGPSIIAVLTQAIVRNLTIAGNCLGTSEDLAAVCAAVQSGAWTVTVDSIFRDQQPMEFLRRSLVDRERFGKVVFVYD